MRSFKLSQKFLDQYIDQEVPWGYGDLSLATYKLKYSRLKTDGSKEEWWETVQRVVEGTFSIQREHCNKLNLEWNAHRAQKSAQRMYEKIFNFKFTPPGRGLSQMGTSVIDIVGSASLNNCGYISTEDLHVDFTDPFTFLMDMSMLGVGMGFDTLGAEKVIIKEPSGNGSTMVIPDSREGWVDALRLTLQAYQGRPKYCFDYSEIRPEGAPIKTFGGIAPGPEPLKVLVESVETLLNDRIGEHITSIDILDIMCMIGKCVVSGNIRRSALIGLGLIDDVDFMEAKDWGLYPAALKNHRWASNNSIMAKVGSDYTQIVDRLKNNGEPGLYWIENVHSFGRKKDGFDDSDAGARGVNPCGEQPLESYELCVDGKTPIQTKSGIFNIEDLTGKETEIWNGEEWSKVRPKMTHPNAELIRVKMTDGSYLDCTKYHKFSIWSDSKHKYIEKEAKDLCYGDVTPRFSLGEINGSDVPFSYEMGLVAGDGYIDQNDRYTMIAMCGAKRNLDGQISGKWYKEQILDGYSDSYQRVNVTEAVPVNIAKDLRSGNFSIFNTASKRSILEFIAGYIDTDGTLDKQIGENHAYTLYGDENKMRSCQILLRRAGIDFSSIRMVHPAGQTTNKGTRKNDLWALHIPTFECEKIPTKIKVGTKFGKRFRKNNAHEKSKLVDSSRRTKIREIIDLKTKKPVYCFNEEKRHMAVFGNVLTHQCTLVETFPARHENAEEYIETLKYAYMYGKTVTLIPTHNKRTNAVMGRNRRIGTSMSGIDQAINKFGRRRFFNDFCDAGYNAIRDWDKTYSRWLCVPESIRKTTVKPSGTTSLLAGAFPGVHKTHSKRYMRLQRVAKAHTAFLKAFKSAGYLIEEDFYDKSSNVVYFPIEETNFKKSKSQTSLREQAQLVADMQYWWSDNAVSCTMTFQPKEEKEIQEIIETYEDKLKTLTIMPLGDHGWIQAPYITVVPNDTPKEKRYKEHDGESYRIFWTEEEFDEYRSKINSKKLRKEIKNLKEEAEGEQYCSNDSCEIPQIGE